MGPSTRLDEPHSLVAGHVRHDVNGKSLLDLEVDRVGAAFICDRG